MAIPHPYFDELVEHCAELESHAAKPFVGIGFRSTTLKYAKSRDLLSGQGAKRSGGRINAIGTFPVIYTSTEPQTAAAESFQNFVGFGFDTRRIRPKIFVGIAIKLSVILDLGDAGMRRRLGVSLGDLAQPWWPVQESGEEALTQALGRAAYDAGFEAVLLPSTQRKGGFNLNVFPEKLRAGSSVAVLEEGDLDRYLK